MALFFVDMDEGLPGNDWRAAVEVLWVGDDVDKLTQLVRGHHVDGPGLALLHWACYYGRVMCTEWLVQSGADKDARQILGVSPLHYATVRGHADCVALLLRHGAHVDTVTKKGWTPLSSAVERYRQQAGRLLIDAGANVKLAREKVEIPPWVDDFLRGREACEKAVIAFVGSSDRQHRDMARLVGELIWNTRGAEEWEDVPAQAKRAK